MMMKTCFAFVCVCVCVCKDFFVNSNSFYRLIGRVDRDENG